MLLIAVSVGTGSAIIGSVYALILTNPGHVLGWWKRWIMNTVHMITAKVIKDDMKAYDTAEYILKPLVTCELCVSGQIALWTFVITQQFNLFGLTLCICQSILTAWIIAQKVK